MKIQVTLLHVEVAAINQYLPCMQDFFYCFYAAFNLAVLYLRV